MFELLRLLLAIHTADTAITTISTNTTHIGMIILYKSVDTLFWVLDGIGGFVFAANKRKSY